MSLPQIIRFSNVVHRLGREARRHHGEIEIIRRQRLQKLLRHAVGTAFFSEKYRGLDLNQIELYQLPPINKRELMANFDGAVTDPAVRRADVESFMAEYDIDGWLAPDLVDPTDVNRVK